jgi:hypothetical protein
VGEGEERELSGPRECHLGSPGMEVGNLPFIYDVLILYKDGTFLSMLR